MIGGAAGAVPPLVGWAATTGSLSWTALYLFAIVFYWTPPHFWALSLLMKDEYAKAGVPMLPVVRGEGETRKQILLYSVLLYAVTQLPFCAGGFGGIYLAASIASRRQCSWAAPCGCTGAPTAGPPCGSTCTRWPTSRCCSRRWWPTRSCRSVGRVRSRVVHDGSRPAKESPIRNDAWQLSDLVRQRRLREHARRPLATNLSEGLTLIEFLESFRGAARR